MQYQWHPLMLQACQCPGLTPESTSNVFQLPAFPREMCFLGKGSNQINQFLTCSPNLTGSNPLRRRQGPAGSVYVYQTQGASVQHRYLEAQF